MTAVIRTARQLSLAKRTGSHFTPSALADYVARRLHGTLPSRLFETHPIVLDPACGHGELLRAFIEATPKHYRTSVKLVGVEDDEQSLLEAGTRLSRSHASYELLNADFLKISAPFSLPPSLEGVLFDAPATKKLSSPDVIIANPPYVRTQVLGARRARQLAARFRLRGRVDLYHAFLIAMTDVLKPGGLIGVITSNRFLTTRSGQGIRTFLSERYDLLEVIDLGDTKLFSAAVLPAVVIARKRGSDHSKRSKPRFARIYEDLSNEKACKAVEQRSLFEALDANKNGRYAVGGKLYEVVSGFLNIENAASEPWRLTSLAERAWTERIENAAAFRIGDLAKVRVGIKTTADSVFIRSDWGSLPEEERPESEALRPLYTHVDAARWRQNKPTASLTRVLYTHEKVDGTRRAINFSRYPRAKKYLERHRARLEERTFVIEAGRCWYEIWVPQDPGLWSQPKVVFPDISVEPRFFLSADDALVNGDCYWLTLPEDKSDLLYLILGCANSGAALKYHDLAFQNKLYSGRRRFITQFVERYPIPDPKKSAAREIIAIAKELHGLGDLVQQPELEAQLDRVVAKAFGIS